MPKKENDTGMRLFAWYERHFMASGQLRRVIARAWLLLALSLVPFLAQAQVSLPNGTYSESVEELRVKVLGGSVAIDRQYLDGRWQINPRWNSLKFAYDPLDSSITSIDRNGSVYARQGDGWIFDKRNLIRRQPVSVLPAAPAGTPTAGIPGQGGQTLASVQGYRWLNRTGDWIDYDTEGRIAAYGDKNDVKVWFQYDAGGKLKTLLDHLGRVVLTYTWSGDLLTQVQDNPNLIAGNTAAAPRSVKYTYSGTTPTTPAYPLLVKATDVLGNDTSYTYEAGKLKTLTDPENRTRTLTYGPTGRINSVKEADGAETGYLYDYDKIKRQFYVRVTGPQTAAGQRIEETWYDSDGRIIRRDLNGKTQSTLTLDTGTRTQVRKDAAGLSTTTQTDEYDNPVKTTYPDGSQTTALYSAVHGQILEETDELGVKTAYDYDARGNLTQKTEAVGKPEQRITEYEVNALGQIIKFTRKGRTEANGRVTPDATWQMEYDDQGKINKTTDPEGNIRQYTYDRAGNLTAYTDPRGNATRYDVDACGNLLKVTDALDRIRSYQYDKVGNLVTYTDARSKASRMAYDAMNHLTQTTNPVGGTHKLQYNGQGLPVAETDEDGRVSRAEFDTFLRLTKQIDGLGNVTEYSYPNADGSTGVTLGSPYDPTEIKYPTYTQQTRYDQRARPIGDTLLNPNSQGTEGLVSSTEYDKRGRIKSETDANGKTRFTTYDALGQLIEATDSLGNKTKALYDARGNLIQITDANGNVNKFEFDRNNRLVKEILPLGQTTRYQYDEVGNLKERIDPNGTKGVYSFDAVNRLTEAKQYRADGTPTRTTGYTWDAADNLGNWSDTDHVRNQTTSAAATYDDANRKTGETIAYPGGNTLSYGYTYSAAGYKTQLTWPDGTQIGYSYSQHGELEGVTIPGEGNISVNQFKWLAPSKITLPGGSTQEYTLDGLLNLEGLKVKNPGQQTVLNVANTYGKVQELKQSNRTDASGNDSTTRNSSYTYDDETRLIQATTDTGGLFGTDTESFTLDAAGNRVAHSKVSGAWTYDANNRLVQRGTGTNATTYEYDDAGNLAQKAEPGNKITKYGYDTQNRLVEAKDGGNNPIARYGYEPLDRRLWKEQYRDAQGNALTTPKRTYYLYADEGLIAEATQDIVLNADQTVTASSTPQIVTQYGPRPDAEFTTGMLFIKTGNSNGQDTFAYYHHDPIGTPIQATDKQGNVVWAASYNVFGQATIITPTPTADTPIITSSLRLPGQVEDAETGLHYNYRRYYDPNTGRYITQDPIGIEGGLNQYRYAEADPINQQDPTGECPMCAAYALCVAECMLEDAGGNALAGECNNWGDSAKNCATSCMLGPLGRLGKGIKRLGCSNSFAQDTLVHLKPARADEAAAQLGKSILKPINQVQVGDEVLALSEWKERGKKIKLDERLGYERVTDVFTSFKAQTLVHLTLDDGQTLTATEGHPFKTMEGWRDAILLKKGGKLLLKGGKGDAGAKHTATIVDIQTETKTLPVFNLEVANAHIYFVGEDGQLVHNAKCKPGKNDPHINQNAKDKARELWEKLKAELEELNSKPNKTPADKAARDKLERQVADAKRKADARGENHSRRGK